MTTAKHARFTASAAERWLNCPGSVRAAEASPARTSPAAAQGTFAHHIAAECLAAMDATTKPANPPKPSDWLGNRTIIDGHEVVCDQEMVDGVEFYLDDCAADVQPGDKTWTELALTEALRKLHPALGGTADRVRWRKATRSLRVTDFKYGAGVLVEADDNKQLQIYALGALLATGVAASEVEVRVVQPRIEHAEGRARSWTFSAVDLLAFADRVVLAVRAGEAEDAPLKPGPWCSKTFCPAAATCPAVEQMQHSLMAMEFRDVAVPVDPVKIATALSMVGPLKTKIKQLEEYAYGLAAAGMTIPGWKIVAKRPTRRWTDEAAVAAWAESNGIDPYDRTLKSPAKLEEAATANAPRGQKTAAKALVKAALAPFIVSESSGEALVPESDPRPPLKTITADDFDVIPEASAQSTASDMS